MSVIHITSPIFPSFGNVSFEALQPRTSILSTIIDSRKKANGDFGTVLSSRVSQTYDSSGICHMIDSLTIGVPQM
jgi:hypothetical protein